MRLLWLLYLLGCKGYGESDGVPADSDRTPDSDCTPEAGADDDCDGADDDCDGEVDEHAPQVDIYADLDRDGYGDPASAATGCDDSNVVTNSSDCDDTNRDVHAHADETCDGADEDCDGVVDEDAIDGFHYYADADADGWGDPASLLVTCGSLPAGWRRQSGDCDDADAAVSPEATEVCGNGVDDDCDGASGGCEVAAAAAAALWEGEGSYEYAGCAIATLGDADGDGYDDYAIAANGASGSSNQGSVYFLDGTARGAASLSTADGVLTGAIDDWAGESLSFAGDVDGDGVGELWVGAYRNDDAGTDAGCVYLVSADWTGASTLAAEYEAVLTGETAGDKAGSTVAAAGDVNGDGHADVVVGSDLGRAAHVVYGPFSGSRDLATADVKLTLFFGPVVAGGHDTDGDGLDDLVVGHQYYGSDNVGAAYVVSAPSEGSSDLASYPQIYGEDNQGYAGRGVASPGDLDEDGYGDVMVAAGFPDPGAVFFGPVTGVQSIRSADVTLVSSLSWGMSINGVAGGGDGDGDGHRDLLVESSDAGAAWLLFGPIAGGTIELDASADVPFVGEEPYAGSFGYSAAFAGDVDGDGTDDILVGAKDRASHSGAAYLFVGL